MLELYQSEDCPDCARVREKLASIGASYVVRTVPIDRARRERVTEAGGRPDIPLLLDPERGRTTYDADQIIEVLGADDLFGADLEAEASLARLIQIEGDPESAEARKALDRAGIDYVSVPARPGMPDLPRLMEPNGGATRIGAQAVKDWATGWSRRE